MSSPLLKRGATLTANYQSLGCPRVRTYMLSRLAQPPHRQFAERRVELLDRGFDIGRAMDRFEIFSLVWLALCFAGFITWILLR